MSYDTWKTTTPEDLEHKPECFCEECHKKHLIDQYIVIENALDFPQDYPCCVEQFKEWIGKIVCARHPYAYNDPVSGCERCQNY